MTTKFNNLIQLLDFFKEESACIAYLAQKRWGDEPTCPHCGTVGAYITNRGYKCKAKECHKKFTVTAGTIYENTKISLRYWFAAIYLATSHKKGISSLQLSRDLNITQKTAWFMLHRIRHMMANSAPHMLNGTVEVDETYVGGKTINKHKKEREERNKLGTGYVHMKPVLAMVERDGNVIAKVIDKPVGTVIKPIISEHIDKSSTVVTDGHGAYYGLNYNHEIINHQKGEFARGIFNTNSVEGFFSLLKRGIIGIYHYTSPKHLHRYCSEFAFRYNSRKQNDCARFEDAFNKIETRLTYAKLIS